MEESNEEANLGRCCISHWRGLLCLFLPILLLCLMLINSNREFLCLYLIIIMVICWVTELLPTAVTAMLPILSFPLMNILPSDRACSLYFKDTLISFLVTIMITAALELSKLNTRGALCIVSTFGTAPRRLHIFMIYMTMLISMIVPNGIVVAVMFPFAKSVCELLASLKLLQVYEDDTQPRHLKRPTKFGIGFFISIAFAASIGGTGNLSGTPANLTFKRIYDKRFPGSPDRIDLKEHALYAIIPMLVNTTLMLVIVQLTHMGLFRGDSPDSMALEASDELREASKDLLDEKINEQGPVTTWELLVGALIFAELVMLSAWAPRIFTGKGTVNGQELTYSSLVVIILYLMFSLPSKFIFLKCWDEISAVKTPGLINWKFVNSYVPWDLIFIIGCGGALAEGSRICGLAKMIGEKLESLKDLSPALSLFLVLVMTGIATNITVNAATLDVLAPGIIQLAVVSKSHPLYFMFPSGLAASMAFLMPTATAPNALVAAFVNLKTRDVIFAGIGPTLISIIAIYICANALGSLAYANLMEFPTWANNVTSVDYGLPATK